MKKVISIVMIFVAIIGTINMTTDYQSVVTTSEDISNKTVQIGGQPFGVKFYSKGVVITKIRNDSPADKAGLRKNDIIVMINNQSIADNEEVKNTIKSSNGNKLTLTVNRDYEFLEFTLTPEYNNGKYTAGMWIKDSCAGIGTITYYDTDTNTFACLGHGICEKDSTNLLPMSEGDICPAYINSIEKGKNGSPGGLNGYFKDEKIGTAIYNSQYGLFCQSNITTNYKEYKVASKKEIENGEAYIYSTISGETPKMYKVNIQSASKLNFNKDKDIIIEITDTELLEKTGGIVQGMSGSPIIQNGKLIGAVTHVFVNNPKKGYGIFAETMLEESSK
jgi:stage IV sporulation protein B